MDRRDFIKVCATLAVASSLNPSLISNVLANQENLLKRYNKALLVDEKGNPIIESQLKQEETYIFFYPYASTPCFLINLGKEVKPTQVKLKDGKTYTWQGGIGSKKSLVAYSAICPHQWSYPTPDYAFISYYAMDKPSETTKKAGVIQCCAHLSIFDPVEGGQVVEGPAEVPLAAIILEEEDGKLYAVGVLGVDQFEPFFENFKQDLRERYGSTAKAKVLVDRCVVMEVSKYVKQPIRC